MAECTDLVLRRDWVRATWWLNPCKEGPGSRLAKGYGTVPVKIDGKWRTRLVHRLTRIAAYGEPPLDHPNVLHACDNPPCRELTHLWDGSTLENNRDCATKGRHHYQQHTHCPRNHLLTDGNLVLHELRRGARVCRICRNAASRASYSRCRARVSA